jgi:hypothetical protein
MKSIEMTMKEYADMRMDMAKKGMMGKKRGFVSETRWFMLKNGIMGKLNGRTVKVTGKTA